MHGEAKQRILLGSLFVSFRQLFLVSQLTGGMSEFSLLGNARVKAFTLRSDLKLGRGLKILKRTRLGHANLFFLDVHAFLTLFGESS